MKLPHALLIALSFTIFLSEAATAQQIDEYARLQDALSKADKAHDEKALAQACFALGKALAEDNRLDSAMPHLERALELDKKLGARSEVFEDYIAIAIVLGHQKRFDQAAQIYKTALADARAQGNDKFVVRLTNDLAGLYVHAGKMDEAKALYNEAIATSAKGQDFVGEAQARLNLAMILSRAGKRVEAIIALDKASECLGKDPEPLVVAQIAFNKANLLDALGQSSQAQISFEQAAAAFAKAGEFGRQAQSLVNLGNSLMVSGSTLQASKVYAQACDLLDQDGNLKQLAQAKIRYGAAMADLGKFDEAHKLHQQAIDLAKQTKDETLAANARYEACLDLYLAGALDKATSGFIQLEATLSKAQSSENKSSAAVLADTRGAIARCYQSTGKNKQALDYLALVDKYYRAVDDKLGALSASNSIACVYLESGQMASYLREYDAMKALDATITDTQKDTREYARITGNIQYNWSQYMLLQDKYADALTACQSSLKSFEKSQDARGRLKALTGSGLIQLVQGMQDKQSQSASYASALNSFDLAKPLAKQINQIENMWDCAIGRGVALAGLHRDSEAEEALNEAIGLFEKEKARYSRDDTKTFSLDLRSTAFEELVSLYMRQEKHQQALAIVERGRARAFVDLLEGRRAGHVIAEGPNAGPRPIVIANADTSTGGNLRSVQVMPRQTSKAPDRDQLIDRGLETATSEVNAKPCDLDELRALCGHSGAYTLEYFVTRQNTCVFVIDKAGQLIHATTLPLGRKQIEASVDASYTSVVEPPKALNLVQQANQDRQQKLSALYQQLISPVEKLLPQDPNEIITIVPHGALFKLPFCALVEPGPDKRFFVEKHALAVVPAISVFRGTQRLKQDRLPPHSRLLAFGNPKFALPAGSGLRDLPYSEKEARKLAELFGKDKTTLKIGADATRDAFISAAPEASIIHLATHGLTDEERPMDSAVLLATTPGDDGIFSVKDILNLPPLKASLITLSACQTGRGRITGDGVAGLSRAFIVAGTPSVLVSLWNVDDVMTEYQMEIFYKEYLGGKSRAHALRDAQMQTLQFLEKGLGASQDTSTVKPKIRPNPRYWGAFQLVGEN